MQTQPYGLRVLGKIVNVIADEKILHDAGKQDHLSDFCLKTVR